VVAGAVPDGCSPTACWGILPDRRHPPVLVPLASRRAAAEAVRQYSHGMTQRARLAKAAVGRGLRSGALQWWLRRRDLLVHVIGPPAGTLLGGHAAEALGRTDLQPRSCSARSGPTRKPVVRLLGTVGRPVGYMKVGWNDLTRLIRSEADTRRRLARARPRTFTAPTLLHQDRWQGLEVIISSALPHRPWRRYAMPPPAVSRRSPTSAASGRPRWPTARGGPACVDG
jgi:hypothetical protein